jgi:hypothetical protein
MQTLFFNEAKSRKRPNEKNGKRNFAVGAVGIALIALGAYWSEHRVSSDFRKAAVEAIVELDSFKDTGACSGLLLYGLGVQRINLAVHRAEVEVSTKADKEAAEDLRQYYQVLTDRDKNCSTDLNTALGQRFAASFSRARLSDELNMSKH